MDDVGADITRGNHESTKRWGEGRWQRRVEGQGGDREGGDIWGEEGWGGRPD